MKYLLLLAVYLFYFVPAHAQAKRDCNKIHKDVDSIASYPGGNNELIKYMNREVKQAINDCYEKDSTMITGMTINLLISSKGQVLDASFDDVELSTACRARLKKQFMAMKQWTPAFYKGKPVCSYYSWLVGGVMWEDQ